MWVLPQTDFRGRVILSSEIRSCLGHTDVENRGQPQGVRGRFIARGSAREMLNAPGHAAPFQGR